MDVKKIKLAAVKEGSLKTDLHRKEFVKAIEALHNEHTSFDTALPFYLCLDQTFDKGKKNSLLFIIGNRKNEWKQYLATQAKDSKQKKNILWGCCYIDLSSKKPTLRLAPDKGNAKKINKINQQGKELFKKAGIVLDWEKGIVLEDTDQAEKAENDAKKQQLATELKSIWNEVSITNKELNIAKDGKTKFKHRFHLLELATQFEKLSNQYNTLAADTNATETLLPKASKQLANLKTKLEENPKIQEVNKNVDAFKTRISRINKLLQEAGVTPIKF